MVSILELGIMPPFSQLSAEKLENLRLKKVKEEKKEHDGGENAKDFSRRALLSCMISTCTQKRRNWEFETEVDVSACPCKKQL